MNEEMNEKRKNRYREKLIYATLSLERTEEWLTEFEKTKKEKDLFAAYKAFQELVEVLTDIIAMFLKDNNLIVKDDYTNIYTLKDKKFITEQETKILIEANGLRNRIVHKYNSIDIETFVESAKNSLKYLNDLIKKFEKWQTK
ncbi:MAG: DUF86 domain-containing protein [Candidatus Pacearchaeota archaeon]